MNLDDLLAAEWLADLPAQERAALNALGEEWRARADSLNAFVAALDEIALPDSAKDDGASARP